MNHADFYNALTQAWATFAKSARAETNDRSDAMLSIQRALDEGYKDALQDAFMMLTGQEPDPDCFETSCEDALCKGRDCNSNYCENRYNSTICNVCAQNNLDVFRCPDVKDCCLACCKCPEHKGEGWTTEDTKPSTTCDHSQFSTSNRECYTHGDDAECWQVACDNCNATVGHDTE